MNTLTELNNKYQNLYARERLERIFEDFDNDRILVTTSFGSTSAVLLHMISQINPDHPIHFVNTTYLFEETLQYRTHLQRKLDLNIIDILPDAVRNRFTNENESWKNNQDLCCFINKIDPLEKVKEQHDVWITGLLGFQNANRQNLRVFEIQEHLVKFHPLIDLSKEDISLYFQINELPQNSLVSRGYQSIGCTHCTSKGSDRDGRWLENQKTECGLHTDLKSA